MRRDTSSSSSISRIRRERDAALLRVLPVRSAGLVITARGGPDGEGISSAVIVRSLSTSCLSPVSLPCVRLVLEPLTELPNRPLQLGDLRTILGPSRLDRRLTRGTIIVDLPAECRGGAAQLDDLVVALEPHLTDPLVPVGSLLLERLAEGDDGLLQLADLPAGIGEGGRHLPLGVGSGTLELVAQRHDGGLQLGRLGPPLGNGPLHRGGHRRSGRLELPAQGGGMILQVAYFQPQGVGFVGVVAHVIAFLPVALIQREG